MSIYTFLPLIKIILCIGLLILLLVSGLHHPARKPFAVLLIFIGLWGFFIFLMRSSLNLLDASFCEILVLTAILGASFFFYRFTISYTGSGQNKGIFYPLYFSYFVFLDLIPTGIVIRGMQTTWYGKAPVTGIMFFLFVLMVFSPIILGLMALMKHRKQSRLLDERNRDSYIITGIVMMIVGGVTDYLPSLGLNVYPLGIIGNILFCVLATIAMLKYRPLEIGFTLRRGISRALTSILILSLVSGFIFARLNAIFKEFFNPVSEAITFSLLFFIAAIFIQPTISMLQHMMDRWVFRNRYDKVQALRSFTKEMGDVIDLKQLTSSLVATVAYAMQSRNSCLLLASTSTDIFETCAYYEENSRTPPFISITGWPLPSVPNQQDSIIDINDPKIPNVIIDSDRKTLVSNHIELMVPLRTSRRLIGLLLVGEKLSKEPYSTEDRQLLLKVTNDVAASIENASLYEGMHKKHEELEKVIGGILHAMSFTIETRDPYTAQHQRQVAALACKIAKKMGLSEWDIGGIRIMGLLHDVGKITVPSEILSKSGRINESEFSIIRTHPQVGYEIIREIDFPWPIIPRVVLQHHERLNGSGYPEGLSGKGIVLKVRILGVANALLGL